MSKGSVILLSLLLGAIAHTCLRGDKPVLLHNLRGWQKLLSMVALILAVIILLNPEFLTLGLLGDSTILDMLTLGLSVQMLVSVQCVWHHFSQGFVRTMRWFGIPSPGFRFLIALSAVYIADAVVACQKFINRSLA